MGNLQNLKLIDTQIKLDEEINEITYFQSEFFRRNNPLTSYDLPFDLQNELPFDPNTNIRNKESISYILSKGLYIIDYSSETGELNYAIPPLKKFLSFTATNISHWALQKPCAKILGQTSSSLT